MFKWVCLVVAVLAVTATGWMLNDLRVELQKTVKTLNDSLPEILENTTKGSETLAVLSEDLKQLRDLVGLSANPRDKSLVAYADSVLDFIESQDAQIGLKKKVFGGGLKSAVPTNEWVVSARKEALWLIFRAKSRDEFLRRLCENKFGTKWFIEFSGGQPVALIEFLSENHPDTKSGQTE